MRRGTLFLPLMFLMFLGPTLRAASRPDQPEPTFDEIASLLAGMPTGSPSLQGIRDMRVWKQFAATVEQNWTSLEAERLGPMRSWGRQELTKAGASGKVLFYPFGGPDFITAFELFPDSKTYIIMGLEACGRLPHPEQWSERQAGAFLANFTASLSDFFNKSYFITQRMDATIYGQDQVEGVLPILCLFLKRSGHSIIDISRVEFDPSGEAKDVGKVTGGRVHRPSAIRIRFSARGSAKITSIIYISCDLQDEAFPKDSRVFLYLDRLAPSLTTFIKSASYLLHYQTFSHIREIIMAKSLFILEDDSGIPYKFFKPGEWRVTLYGEYAKPIKDFAGVDQPDLKKAYEDNRGIFKKLTFHLGYHWRDRRDAMLLIERTGPPQEFAPRKSLVQTK